MHVDVYDGFNLRIYIYTYVYMNILHITYIIVRNPDLSN